VRYESSIFINPVILDTIFWEIVSRQVVTLVESRSFECGIVVLKYAKAT